jgi:hypothetical protein
MSKTPFATAAAKIDDEIIAIGEFQAHGASKHMIEGSMAGNVVGSLLPGKASDLGAITGLMAGEAAGARVGTRDDDGAYRWLLAVSPTKVYVLESVYLEGGLSSQAKDLLDGAVDLKHTFDRADLEITVKARVAVRLLTIEDHATGTKLELEGIRHGVYHATDVIRALTDHQDEDHKTEAPEAV